MTFTHETKLMAFKSLNKVQEISVLPFSEEHPLVPVKYLGNMPASKKDLRAQKQKKNVEAGIGDAKGRLPSQVKVWIFLTPPIKSTSRSQNQPKAKKYSLNGL